MLKKMSTEIHPIHNVHLVCATDREFRLPFWLFRNKDLITAFDRGKTIDEAALRNILNHIHFMEGYVLVHLRHPEYEESVLAKAHIEPCVDSLLTCYWANENASGFSLQNYQFMHLIIEDGKFMILVPAELQERDERRLILKLPSKSYSAGQRQARRFKCQKTEVDLIQTGYLAKGELLDFSPIGLRVRLKSKLAFSINRFNPDASAIIIVRSHNQVLFSGPCHCVRQQKNRSEIELVLIPVPQIIRRVKANKIRNPRQQLAPPPRLSFSHPLLGKRFEMEVSDISTSGFCVYEKPDEGVLIQGLIIPDMEIDFVGVSTVKCMAQVVYRVEQKGEGIRCGLTTLDMQLDNYTRLADILSHALNPHTYVSNEVRIDELWEFFFESGFIYPMKYRLIKTHRDEFKETYRKLYLENPEIAVHFTYRKNGRIYGHVSMVRAYEKTWMVQHHAARTKESRQAGFVVLKQIIHYLNDMFRLPSANADYVMVYFRPENKFPNRTFGGFARALNNPKGCSMDLFSYLPYTAFSLGTRLPEGWFLQECSSLDLWELSRFYNHYSGGLLLDTLCLERDDTLGETLEEVYDRLGFIRKWKAYSLGYRGKLNAVLIVEQSDLGLNLSELLNGIKIIVTNPDVLPWETLSIAIGQLASIYEMSKVPVLIYPAEYAVERGIPFEKQYQVWIYHAHFMGQLMQYLNGRFRISYWK